MKEPKHTKYNAESGKLEDVHSVYMCTTHTVRTEGDSSLRIRLEGNSLSLVARMAFLCIQCTRMIEFKLNLTPVRIWGSNAAPKNEPRAPTTVPLKEETGCQPPVGGRNRRQTCLFSISLAFPVSDVLQSFLKLPYVNSITIQTRER